MEKKIIEYIIKIVSKIIGNLSAALSELKRHLYFLDFENRDEDIYIVSFPRSGTTWMQVIVHNLISGGDMSFNHIYDVSPWPSNQAVLGESAEKINQLPSPRIFKSHDLYSRFDEKMKNKVIFLYRNVEDVAISLYYHNKNYLDQTLTFEKNLNQYFLNKDGINWFEFNGEWFRNKHNFQVLYISYESLKNNFEPTLFKIADFLSIKLDDELLTKIKLHASFDYMKKHESKFGEVKMEHEIIYDQFIRKGEVGKGEDYVNENQRQLLNEKFNKLVEPFIKNTNSST